VHQRGSIVVSTGTFSVLDRIGHGLLPRIIYDNNWNKIFELGQRANTAAGAMPFMSDSRAVHDEKGNEVSDCVFHYPSPTAQRC
jgi:hypothetical protein